MKITDEIKDIIRRITGEVPTKTLVKRGLTVGIDFNRQQGCYIDPTHCFLIEIGDHVTMSIRVVLLAHDASTKKILGYTKIGQIHIGNNVFIGANTTVLPNVRIGDNCIIGANSIVTKNVPENTVAAGNPARVICSVEEYIAKWMTAERVFDESYRFSKTITKEKIEEMKRATKEGISFIV